MRSPKARRTPWLRSYTGAMVLSGDVRLVLAFQRFFPGKLGSKGRVAPILEVEQTR